MFLLFAEHVSDYGFGLEYKEMPVGKNWTQRARTAVWVSLVFLFDASLLLLPVDEKTDEKHLIYQIKLKMTSDIFMVKQTNKSYLSKVQIWQTDGHETDI